MKNIPEAREDTLKDWRDDFRTILRLCRDYKSLSLRGIQDWGIRRGLGKEVRQQLRDLIGIQIGVVERRVLA